MIAVYYGYSLSNTGKAVINVRDVCATMKIHWDFSYGSWGPLNKVCVVLKCNNEVWVILKLNIPSRSQSTFEINNGKTLIP